MSTSDSSCKDGASKSNYDDDVCEVMGKLSAADNKDGNGVSVISVCANCGKEDNNLKSCTACKMVKYCNRECQIAHRPMHKKECRRLAAELHDEKLFKQPPSLHGDCPICFMRIPTLITGKKHMTCCGKVICSGCMHAPVYDSQGNEVDNEKCPFCRTPFPESDEEDIKRTKKRVEANDAVALFNRGNYYRDGRNGFLQSHTKAIELFHRAGELGYSESYNNIGYAYDNGEGVEIDEEKANHYYELAAMGGDADARYNLGNREVVAGNMDRAIKHHMIAVGSGDNDSLDMIKKLYSTGDATKEDYTEALRAYQAYLVEIKSDARDKAAAFSSERYRYY